ncbi:uncharacterized protein RAG0_12032 [Rhynchosporium agropyri]|uniref:Efficient mitochondria targeting-associated protein 19 n=1 Tax=Rhynchosporium agropyri TaxID=914238 RepID=A0A1E1L6Y2_9HELO|nr:uncharacterized protein RAG0_12032 [Rhynchosporium agropyri]
MAPSILSRKRDLVYFVHFSISLPLMFLVDMQALYPVSIVPGFMKALKFYLINTHHDQFFIDPPAWFRAFIWTEFLYQAPVMIWSLGALRRSSPRLPVVLLPYALLVFVTTATCMYEYSFWEIPFQHKIDLTTLYGPYLALSAFMFVDMWIRLNNIVNKSIISAAKTNPKKLR